MKQHPFLLFLTISFFYNASYSQETGQTSLRSQALSFGERSLRDSVKRSAEQLISTGFTAGDGYGEVWIRDFNTFMAVACKVNDHKIIKKHLLTFFKFQQPDGQILDGYIPIVKSNGGYKYYYSSLAPEFAGHKNTVETDQETSLVQAVGQYIRSTQDMSILEEVIDGITVDKRMEKALHWLLEKRFSSKYGLIWGATTVDWGDVQPESDWGVEMDSSSHTAIDIYDNAMFMIAIQDYLNIKGPDYENSRIWVGIHKKIKTNVRKYLWDEKAEKFRPHIYLDRSPFPSTFNEDEIYYHGGTAVAIEAGVLSKKEVKRSYLQMLQNVKMANAASIGLTNYPVYPEGFFKNPGMKPYSYQNGGDWTWFGARMITQLARYGLLEEARQGLKPMLERVLKNKGFYEWYTIDNQPKGSSSFRGEAGVLWTAITSLENL